MLPTELPNRKVRLSDSFTHHPPFFFGVSDIHPKPSYLAELYIFDQDLDYSYWLNNKGQSTNYASVSGIHQKDSNNIKNINPYFYPNPVSSSLGKFRFYNTDHTAGSIKIYSSSGFLMRQ